MSHLHNTLFFKYFDILLLIWTFQEYLQCTRQKIVSSFYRKEKTDIREVQECYRMFFGRGKIRTQVPDSQKAVGSCVVLLCVSTACWRSGVITLQARVIPFRTWETFSTYQNSSGKCFLHTQQIRHELLESQLKVASLQDMSCQLLVNAEGTDCLEAKEKVHVIGNRLKLLLKEVSRHLKELEKLLDMSGSQQVSSRQTSLCGTSLRAPKKRYLDPF